MYEPEEREGYEKAWYRQMLRQAMALASAAVGEEIVFHGELWRVECDHVMSVGHNGTTDYINLPSLFDKWFRAQVQNPIRTLITELEGAAAAREPEVLLTLRQWIRSDDCKLWNPGWQQEKLQWLEKKEKKEREEDAMQESRVAELNRKRHERQEMLDSMRNEQLKQAATAHDKDGTWKSAGSIVDECLSKARHARSSRG